MRREVVLALCAFASALACSAPVEPADPSVAITPIAVVAEGLHAPDGTRVDAAGRPHLLHFWATWCAPCRRELPSLLAAATETGVREWVIAVSVDGGWAEVVAFFGSAVPRGVVRETEGATARALGVSTLPDTYLIDENGLATRRIDHALDWERAEHRAWLAAALGRPE